MGLPTVKGCCCCIELRTAGMVLGILGIIGSVMQIFKGAGIVGSLCGIAICGLYIYGIRTERTSFMLPLVILGGIGLIILYLLPFILIILVLVVFQNDEENEKYKALSFILLFLVIYVIACAIATYFWIVEYSVYKVIKDEVEDREKGGRTVAHHEVPLKHEV